jgi:pilus assembly protein CpaB
MRRSKLGLIFALALGLMVALVVWNYTQRLQTQLRQASEAAAEKARLETADVLVAAHDIPAHTKLTLDQLKVQQMPKQAKLAAAFTKVDDAVGKETQYPISDGEQILPSKFVAARGETGLAYVIPPGMRAVSIKASEVIGAGGFVQAGDRVDVIGSFDKDKMGKDEAVIVLQNVEVLAVAQTPEGDQGPATPPGVTDQVAGKVNAPAVPGTTPTGPTPTATPVKPKTQPEARTVTLAVSPEQSQRLVLAEDQGRLRLALRPAKDTSTVEIPEATLSQIRSPIEQPSVQITSVQFSPTTAKAGDTLKIQMVVKNTSNKPVPSQGPSPEFTYVQGQTFFSQNFPSQEGKFRVGVSFDGQPSAPFPYRWGFGGDLAPGASVTVTGYVKLTYDLKPTNFWAGIIQEPGTFLQDNVGTTLITVLPTNVAVIAVDAANVRSGPDVASSVISKLNYGTEVPILGQEKDWFKIKLPDGREGFVAAGWIIAPQP